MRQEKWRDILKRQDMTHRESLLALEVGLHSVPGGLQTEPCSCCLTPASRVCGEGG